MTSRGDKGVERSGQTTGSLPVMAWWRCLLRQDIADQEAVLRQALVTQTRGLVADDLIRQVQPPCLQVRVAALQAAVQLQEAGADEDLVMSWVTVAALAGNAIACRMLADSYIEAACNYLATGEGVDAVLLLDCAVDWLFDSEMQLDHRELLTAGGRKFLARALRQLEPDEKPGPRLGAITLASTESGAATEDASALQVVKEIGDQDGKEGKDLARRYERLTKPLRLAGSKLDLEVLATVLRMEFPWFESAITAIIEDLRLLKIAGIPWLLLRLTLLVGPPGGGKTRFARRVGQLAGTGSDLISASGSSDNRMLMGTARGWSSAQPALPLLTMARTGTANPVIVVDEIDKVASSSRNGDIRSVLLMLLERETAKVWTDECLLASCDLSQISWLLTANQLTGIPKPLLSRLRVVHVEAPGTEHFDVLYHGLIRDLADELMVSPDLLPALDPMAIECLREQFGKGASVRKLRAAIAAALANTCPNTRRLN